MIKNTSTVDKNILINEILDNNLYVDKDGFLLKYVLEDYKNHTNYKNGGNDDWGKQVQFDSSYTTRSAEETRPKNISFIYIIKSE
ncbi:hypothetical protein IG611_09775 [Pectobacterium sp. A535-S3-A17]|uniref:hypothetical protein n=1 Tax=Pectobacterium quasiaquaticum TaxID=2774015 RepID=UPI0018738F21|nr:hypothetical protein [Pectobacterium quasiaquaticum]MBE5212549.1 hypothetical protein [Pectobacterium quasiaquaticum]MBE5225645.1 hypothetical protein [Pectobacterium quasiaquaticum]